MEAVCSLEGSTPVEFRDVYEEGDIWVKTIGCEGCSWENMQKCCGNCPHLMRDGCNYHLERRSVSNKPFKCVVWPTPDVCHSYCQQEYRCIKGTNEGLVRRVRDKRDVFQTG